MKNYLSGRGFQQAEFVNHENEKIRFYERSFAESPTRIGLSTPLIFTDGPDGKEVFSSYTLNRKESFKIALVLFFFSVTGKLFRRSSE